MSHHKVVVIGSGPAGYTAAIYTGRAQLSPVVFAGQKAGGQLMWTTEIENFPGFQKGINGPGLMMEMMAQAQRFGATIRYDYITAVDFSARPFKLWTHIPQGALAEQVISSLSAEEYAKLRATIIKTEPAVTADAVIVATGATSVMIGAPGEEQFLGRGVSTCAVCDAAFYRDKDTIVVGGGDSAMEDALALTKFAKSVTLVHRRDSFKASKIMQERVLSNPKVKVLWNTKITKIVGEQFVTGVELETNGVPAAQPIDGVFVAIGHKPVSGFLAGQLALDAHGYVITRQSVTTPGVSAAQAALQDSGLVAYPTMTSVEGVFAGGDGVDVRYRQAITAAGQGCAAALDAERWLETQE